MNKRTILITGASSGIGLEAVNWFFHNNYEVAATVRKKADEERLANEFPGITVLNVDLNDEKAIDKVIGGYFKDKGGVDVVVNNAGFAQVGPVEELGMAEWRGQFDTNFFAPIQICRLVLPYMREKKSGRIIQVSSGAGKVVMPIFGPYCSSKFALEAFTEAMYYEVAQFGIGVSMVAPGPVTSKFDANRQVSGDFSDDGPYRETIARQMERTAQAHKNESTAADVVAKIAEAAESKSPKLRYPIGLMGRAAGLKGILPQGVFDIAMKS